MLGEDKDSGLSNPIVVGGRTYSFFLSFTNRRMVPYKLDPTPYGPLSPLQLRLLQPTSPVQLPNQGNGVRHS